MFRAFSYLRQHNDENPIDDYKSFYRRFSNEREFGSDFTNMDHLVKNRFHNTINHVYNAILRKNPQRIIDIGCGNGVNLPISRIFPEIEYTGLDYAENSIIAAKKSYPEAKFITGDAFNTGIESKSFDMAIMASLLILYEDRKSQQALLRESSRILTENGTLVLIVWNQAPLLVASIKLSRLLARMTRTRLPEDFMAVYFTRNDVRNALQDTGLIIEEVLETGDDYGVLEAVRYLSMAKYHRTFGKAESESGREHPQNILEDLTAQSGCSPILVRICHALARTWPGSFSMYSVYLLRKTGTAHR
ncbi:MAG: class I SAM-dependent methyltransferase [Candidatus Sericytochromatia bacterium]|nr:class I SAM-dependent methyltransferase [Candidatus Sericytochromatia bacterium]